MSEQKRSTTFCILALNSPSEKTYGKLNINRTLRNLRYVTGLVRVKIQIKSGQTKQLQSHDGNTDSC